VIQLTNPTCTIIAGPNGAGKTTFALDFFPNVLGCRNFVNADLIASGLAPLAPERQWNAAGRLFLNEIHRFIDRRQDFGFETTLSGRTYLKLIRELQADGWEVNLYYLWLPSVEMCVRRVAERVLSGGHHIPTESVTRRYSRSIKNLLGEYSTLCNNTYCYDNSEGIFEIIYFQQFGNRTILNRKLYSGLQDG
jgi:predicted ABC-type ATPase